MKMSNVVDAAAVEPLELAALTNQHKEKCHGSRPVCLLRLKENIQY